MESLLKVLTLAPFIYMSVIAITFLTLAIISAIDTVVNDVKKIFKK